MIQSKHPSEVTVIEITDPGTIARHRKQEAFVAETSEEAWDWARTQHPNDDGAIVMFVPREKTWKIYAHRR
jgi:hypothetical protein